MPIRTPILSALLALLLLTHPVASRADNVRSDIEQGYRRIAAAIKGRELSALLHTNYLWRNPDGTLPSRQEMESVWRANFAAVKAYTSVTFAIERLKVSGGQVLATVSRTVFYTLEGVAEEQLEVSRSRDTWKKREGGWRFAYRETLPGTLTGHVLEPKSTPPDSPRLMALSRAMRSGSRNATGTFWREMQGKAPLIEPISGDPIHRRVTFLWRGSPHTQEVKLRGGLPSEAAKPLVLLPGTDVWYRTERLPADARFAYSLWVTDRVQRPSAWGGPSRTVRAETYPPDPLNPRVINDGPYVELPGAPPQPWQVPMPGAPKGKLTREIITSMALKEERAVTVYTPAGYATAGEPCRLLVLFDGEDYQSLIPAPTILDNLTAHGNYPPTVALFVHSQGTRFRDLHCSPTFADFVATELVPWARARYPIRPGPQYVTVGGLSLGGLMAGYCGLRHAEVFGNVLSQSGAFWYGTPERASDTPPAQDDGWLAHQFAAASRLPLRFWLEVGRLEAASMVQNNRRLRDVLSAKGYEMFYSEFTGGHDYLSWRGSLADALMTLAKDKPSTTTIR